MIKFETHSVEETKNFGYKLGTFLEKGDIIYLKGDLGTGKTAFTSGIAKALAIHEHITSPTFTIVNQYSGKLPLYHFDVYRINDVEEMYEIGFEEYIDGKGIVVIEWGELIKELIPPQHIFVAFEKNLKCGLDERIIKINFNGAKNKNLEEIFSTNVKGF